MTTTASYYVAFIICMTWGCCALPAAALSPEESDKQKEFNKTYRNPDHAERQKSLAILAGAASPSSWNMLANVVRTDPDKDVRAEAARTLCHEPARDASLAQMTVSVFQSIKPTDVDAKLDMAAAMQSSEFKTEIINVLADFGSRLPYPDLRTANRPAGGGAIGGSIKDPNVMIGKQRLEFEKFLTAFNAIAHSDISIPDKNSPAGIRKWWEQNRAKSAAADKELLEKYRTEDKEKAKADKDKPK